MRILLLTFGTEGDVRPFVALARGLQARGHEVAICTADGFAGLVEGAGVTLLGFGNEWYEATRATMEGAGGVRDLLAGYRPLMTALESSLDRQWQRAREFEPDLVVFHPKPLAGPHLAERLGVPGVLAVPLPLFHPTSAYPSAMMPGLPRPAWPLGYWLAQHASGPYAGMLNRFRARLGLPRLPRGRTFLDQPDGSPRPVLYAYSPTIVPPPPEYPPHVHVTGQWFLDTDDEPAPEVAAFVAAGRPDLYLGFGSMALGGSRERLSDAVAGALRRTGARAVVGTGWGGVTGADLPSTALATGHVPHSWLFPRVDAVVHHGGSGTVGGGLRAGRPTLVCPLLGDQPFWGERVRALGVGPAPVAMRSLTADRLARGIDALLSEPGHARRATEVAAAMAAEDGVAAAVAVLERVVS